MPYILLLDHISNALENNKYVLGVFLDFSKAFDTVDHSILLSKLHFYGIRGVAYSWIKSYLENRRHYIVYNDVMSDSKIINYGVPQG